MYMMRIGVWASAIICMSDGMCNVMCIPVGCVWLYLSCSSICLSVVYSYINICQVKLRLSYG